MSLVAAVESACWRVVGIGRGMCFVVQWAPSSPAVAPSDAAAAGVDIVVVVVVVVVVADVVEAAVSGVVVVGVVVACALPLVVAVAVPFELAPWHPRISGCLLRFRLPPSGCGDAGSRSVGSAPDPFECPFGLPPGAWLRTAPSSDVPWAHRYSSDAPGVHRYSRPESSALVSLVIHTLGADLPELALGCTMSLRPPTSVECLAVPSSDVPPAHR